jgi:hypothetical protein
MYSHYDHSGAFATRRVTCLVLEGFLDASRSEEMNRAACPSEVPATQPGRLEAVVNRLQAMLQAVETIRLALADCYGALSDDDGRATSSFGGSESWTTTVPPSLSKSRASLKSRNDVLYVWKASTRITSYRSLICFMQSVILKIGATRIDPHSVVKAIGASIHQPMTDIVF